MADDNCQIDSYDDDDYHGFLKARECWAKQLETSPSRFVPMKDRHDTSSLSAERTMALQHGKCNAEWKGMSMLKDGLESAIYQMMLWKIKPTTILEIGTYTGASALWMADHLRMFDISGHVYSIDLDPSLLDERARGKEGITFIEGDCNKIEHSFPSEMLAKLPHPWIVIEDAHVNLDGVLEHFYRHMTTGDYIVVEDTNPDIALMDFSNSGKIYSPFGISKMNELRSFAEGHPVDLRVDTYYTDMFGYNGTANINGYIRKM